MKELIVSLPFQAMTLLEGQSTKIGVFGVIPVTKYIDKTYSRFITRKARVQSYPLSQEIQTTSRFQDLCLRDLVTVEMQ